MGSQEHRNQNAAGQQQGSRPAGQQQGSEGDARHDPAVHPGQQKGASSRHAHQTADDKKELHELFPELSGEELKQIPILSSGTHLEAEAKYLRVSNGGRTEVQAKGDEEVGSGDLYIAKKDVPYELWNRLIGIDDPRRTKQF
jgi:hypothetical protein